MAADWEAYNLFSSIDKVVGTQRQVQLGWLCVVTDDFQTKPALGFQELVDMRPGPLALRVENVYSDTQEVKWQSMWESDQALVCVEKLGS